ncbi:MAG: hypothetical protein RXQ74_06520 [Caldivirga sp.]|jgi:Ca2+/Na+ antiporter|uniref:hypothetical protein n=1 Tax=Caldivirga sp. MU80 TaxID=1650354 RepID=UPI00074A3A08|nr:hypothetical protein [Caldivirga sp. MU80]KUO83049.1 MAG: hypothetical protein AT709_02925 [Caldivirga sp. MG_3]KUO91938.1 MAG: hypothetical protein AT713_03590 [Caldivirga sp. JCHS_4]MDT7902791.1 hypothetical protein [Caldivirga sp.]NAZ28900.1 hypothetical protein [Caldivirga sp.]
MELDPAVARLAYTLSIMFLVLALFALPFNLHVEAALIIDLVVIVMLVAFLIFVIISVRRSR